LHAGDVVTLAVLRELEAFAPVEAVYGNMDEPALAEVLPERRVVEVGGARIGLVHIPGARAGREERLMTWFPR
jgi:predicted phosphodiesterase